MLINPFTRQVLNVDLEDYNQYLKSPRGPSLEVTSYKEGDSFMGHKLTAKEAARINATRADRKRKMASLPKPTHTDEYWPEDR